MLTTLPTKFPIAGTVPPFGPWFGISASKAKAFAECPRAWWQATNGAHEGWESNLGLKIERETLNRVVERVAEAVMWEPARVVDEITWWTDKKTGDRRSLTIGQLSKEFQFRQAWNRLGKEFGEYMPDAGAIRDRVREELEVNFGPTRLAYVLGKLGSLYGVAGNTVGRAVYAYLQGKLKPAQLVEAGLRKFDAEVEWMRGNSVPPTDPQDHDTLAPCERDPKESPGLEEYYYETDPARLARRLAAARQMVADALDGAARSEYLAAMKAGAFGRVTCEADDAKPETFWLGDVMTWVIPDIVTNNGVVRIIDLKAGKIRPEHVLQVQIYAIWAAEKFGKPVKAFLLYLAEGERISVDCSAEALAAAKAEMLSKAAEIQSRLVDPRCNLGSMDLFPQNLRACRGCKFFESCHGHRDRDALR